MTKRSGSNPPLISATARAADPIERDHTIKGRDEVGDDRRPINAQWDRQRSCVTRSELRG